MNVGGVRIKLIIKDEILRNFVGIVERKRGARA